MRFFVLLFATGLGTGYSPIAPGTMGTLVAVPAFLLLSSIPFPLYELTLFAFFFLATWLSDNAERYFGKKDDGRIVIDEVMGFFLTMLWIPGTVLTVVIGFFLFRFFDIFKPFPIRHVERKCKGGWGVVLDDVLAGIYANIALHIIVSLIVRN